MTGSLPILSDNLQKYFAEIRCFRVLTPEEEYQLAVKYYEEKDLEAAHTLVTSNLVSW